MQIERFFEDVVGQNRQTLPDYFAPSTGFLALHQRMFHSRGIYPYQL